MGDTCPRMAVRLVSRPPSPPGVPLESPWRSPGVPLASSGAWRAAAGQLRDWLRTQAPVVWRAEVPEASLREVRDSFSWESGRARWNLWSP